MDLSTAFTHIHWISVLAAAFSAFFIGGIWYGPLFGKAWMKELEFTEDDLGKRSIPRTFGLSLVLAFIAALGLEMFIGVEADLMFGALAGFFAGFGWVATMLGILYLFEMKTLKVYFINAGYCIFSLTAMGLILGVW